MFVVINVVDNEVFDKNILYNKYNMFLFDMYVDFTSKYTYPISKEEFDTLINMSIKKSYNIQVKEYTLKQIISNLLI